MNNTAPELLHERRKERAQQEPITPAASSKQKGSTPSADGSEQEDGAAKGRQAPASAPPALRERQGSVGKGELKMNNIVLVEDNSIIEKNMELMKLIRAPRYFDDNIGEDPGLLNPRLRCFNCGELGHRIADCTNATRLKPCHLCAQLGHDARDCPSRLCFKCGRPGHMARDCTSGRVQGWESATVVCNRCGLDVCECAGKGDYYRYEGNCHQPYSASDLVHCRCYVCGRMGHLCCTKPPVVPVAPLSCYFCGAEGHRGENCPHENRPHLHAERQGDVHRAQAEREAEEERAIERAMAERNRRGGRGGPGFRYGSTGRTMSRGGPDYLDGGGARRTHKRFDDSDDEDDLRGRLGAGGGWPSRRYIDRDDDLRGRLGSGGGGGGGRYGMAAGGGGGGMFGSPPMGGGMGGAGIGGR